MTERFDLPTRPPCICAWDGPYYHRVAEVCPFAIVKQYEDWVAAQKDHDDH